MADPFQPKFVDLVRNYSTTVGTGNFVLGPAVNGHSSFATALISGDNFYYSAIGVDKPAEREVGRGQLLADGTISRTPVSGPKTSFTSGNKTIALIAAAEWFTTIQAGGSSGAAASAEQAATSASEAAASATSASNSSTAATAARTGAETAESGAQLAESGALEAEAGAEAARDAAIAAGGGGGGGQAMVATRAALAALTNTELPVILTEAGREGIFVWSSASQAANVSLDTFQGFHVAPSSDTSGASGAWIRRHEGDVQLGWFGVADGASNNSARVESAVALFGLRAATFQLPRGKIAFDGKVVINRPVHIRGHGPSNYSAIATGATVLEFPAGSTGFSFTHLGGNAGAQGAKLSDLSLFQPTRLTTTGLASHNPASPNTITGNTLLDIANGQTIVLEGAGTPLVIPGRTAAMTSGSNVVTKAQTGDFGNSVGYVGQMISIAGAGAAGAALTGYIGTWGIGTLTVVDSAGVPLNASTTVSGAAISVYAPLIAEVLSGGGTATLTLDQAATNSFAVTNAIIRHRDPGIYASCTVHGDRISVSGFHAALVLHGETANGAIADGCNFHNSILSGEWAGVVFDGYDAQVNQFFGCNFAGPEVSILDNSILGNDLIGCHWAFNCGIQVFRTGAVTKIIGGYFEQGTSYMAPAGGAAGFLFTTSLQNGAGFNGIANPGGSGSGLMLPQTAFIGDISAEDGLFTKSILTTGTSMARVQATGAATPPGSAGIGYEIFVDGTRAHGQAYNRTANAYVPYRVSGSQVELAPGGVVKATLDASTLTLATALTATGAINGSNLSGTNSGDQFTAMATARLLGRVTVGTGAAEQLTGAQAKAMLAITPADVTGLAAVATSGSGADLSAGSVTYAKLQNAAAARLIGNSSGTAGVPAEIGLGANLGFSGTNVQVQLAANARLLGRTTAGAGASEEIGVANGITLGGGTLGLGDLSPASVAASGAITSTGGGVGYSAGAGGAVIQTTNKTSAVTLHKLSGRITMHAASMAAAAIVEFTVNNSQVVVGDTINLNLASGAANSINYRYWVSAVGSNLFKIVVENRSAGALAEALVLNFAVFKAVTA